MALDIEGNISLFQDRHMPTKPTIMDGARFRKPLFQRNGRNVNARAGGAHIASEDPEAELHAMPEQVRKQVEEKRATHKGRTGNGSVHVFTVVDENGKKRTIIDL